MPSRAISPLDGAFRPEERREGKTLRGANCEPLNWSREERTRSNERNCTSRDNSFWSPSLFSSFDPFSLCRQLLSFILLRREPDRGRGRAGRRGEKSAARRSPHKSPFRYQSPVIVLPSPSPCFASLPALYPLFCRLRETKGRVENARAPLGEECPPIFFHLLIKRKRGARGLKRGPSF